MASQTRPARQFHPGGYDATAASAAFNANDFVGGWVGLPAGATAGTNSGRRRYQAATVQHALCLEAWAGGTRHEWETRVQEARICEL